MTQWLGILKLPVWFGVFVCIIYTLENATGFWWWFNVAGLAAFFALTLVQQDDQQDDIDAIMVYLIADFVSREGDNEISIPEQRI